MFDFISDIDEVIKQSEEAVQESFTSIGNKYNYIFENSSSKDIGFPSVQNPYKELIDFTIRKVKASDKA